MQTAEGFRYYVHFIDATTMFTWFYPLKNKYDTLATFIHFKTNSELHTGHRIKSFQSEGGGEFTALSSYLSSHGIHHRVSCPYTPQQNGLAERKHRYIIDIGLTLLAQAKLPRSFWHEAFHTVVHLINKLPTFVLHNNTPLELLFKTKPNYMFLKSFDPLSLYQI